MSAAVFMATGALFPVAPRSGRQASSQKASVSPAPRSQLGTASPVNTASGKAVRPASHSQGQTSLAERTTVAERVAAQLVSRYPSKTADCVAADTGIKAETIQKILNRVSMPSGLLLLRLVAAYGPDFLAACMGDKAPAWLITAEREKRAAELKARRAAIDAELAQIEN